MESFERDNERITCEEAQLLMMPVWANDPGVSQAEREAFEAHLLVCATCAEEYEETKWLMPLVKKYWGPISEGTRELLEEGDYSVAEQEATPPRRTRPMTVEESWEDLKRRSPSLAEACRRQEEKDKRHRLFRRIGTAAAAASILVAVGIGWIVLQNRGNSQPGPDIVAIETPDKILANAFAELVTSTGRQKLALGQPIKAEDQPQEIMLGGMHRVVMNRNTTATFMVTHAPAPEGDGSQDGAVPYEIQLAQGELYVEVVPGHPFTVRTDNALLTITGTKFDVFAGPGRTELILVKGSVRFSQVEASDQWVDVTAGHASSIVGQSVPTDPYKVDALAAVVWARNLALNNALAHVELDDSFLDMARDAWIQPSPPDLDSIDYDTWLERKRDWFAREFPWIFKAQKVLREQHGIEPDYIDLLMVSGDIWQFNYPRPFDQPIPIFDPASIKRIAKHYEIEDQQLLKAAQAPSLNPATAKSQPATIGLSGVRRSEVYLSALKDWQSAITSSVSSPDGLPTDLLLFNFHAGAYLANTRTAAYLWIKEGPEKAETLLADEDYRLGYLSLFVSRELQSIKPLTECVANQIAVAHRVVETTQELFVAPKGIGCEGQVQRLVGQLSAHTDRFGRFRW